MILLNSMAWSEVVPNLKMPISVLRLKNCYHSSKYYLYCGHKHCNEKNPIYVFPEKELRGLSSYFHIYVSMSDYYNLAELVHIFSCSRIGRLIVRIYKLLTDT
jgi:hypothetical protein